MPPHQNEGAKRASARAATLAQSPEYLAFLKVNVATLILNLTAMFMFVFFK
jgi:hypothetical protein